MKPGETFAQGKYTLIRKLRASGMAEVWLARQHGTEGFAKDVVIKRILPHLAEDEKLVTMFLDEARIAANLNHPNVVQIFDLGNDGRNYFIAMEYIRGHDLEQIQDQLKQRRMPHPLELAVQMVSNTCLGLAYAHDCKTADGTPMQVVHRDVSPQNVLVSEAGVVKLIDFGIAKARTSSTRTQVGHTKGKICYMSPEQMMARELDRRSDIFSLGVVMYEMICAVKPFDGENLLACYHKMKQGIPDPRTHRDDIPAPLANIVMKALAYDREDRYPTATALRYELQRYLNNEGVSIGPEHLSDFLTWLFSPPDSTQFVFDFPHKKKKPEAAPEKVMTPPSQPLPTLKGPPPNTTQDYQQRSTPPAQPSAPRTPALSGPIGPPMPPAGRRPHHTGPQLMLDDSTIADDSPIGGSQYTGLNLDAGFSHTTGPELGVVPLDLDEDLENPYSMRRRKKRSNPLMFLLPLLLLGGGGAGAYFMGFFDTQTNLPVTPEPPSIATPAKNADAGAAPEKLAKAEPIPEKSAVRRRRPPTRRRKRTRPPSRNRRRVARRRRRRRRRVTRRRRRRRVRRRYSYRRVIVHVSRKHNARVIINGGEYIRLPMVRSVKLRSGWNRFFFMWPNGSQTKRFRLRPGKSIIELDCRIKGRSLACKKKRLGT